jgi:hypothetical protein
VRAKLAVLFPISLCRTCTLSNVPWTQAQTAEKEDDDGLDECDKENDDNNDESDDLSQEVACQEEDDIYEAQKDAEVMK